MAIQVTCPSCLKRFSVSDKFAGKSGPCPNCQKQIKIPEKSAEVVIHAPETDAPKDSKGRSILKPIRRKDVQLSLPVILGASLGTVVVFGIALGLGLTGGSPPPLLLSIGAVLLAVPLVYTGYWFMHDDELEGFTGRQLMIRCGICSILFAAIWGIYVFVPKYVSGYESTAEITGLEMVIFVPIMIAAGTAASVAALELEVIQGALHYGFYLGITFILAWLSGAPLARPLVGENTTTRPAGTTVDRPGSTSPSPLPSPQNPQSTEPPANVPKLLQ
jgi:hypothetical protein